jgi:hypothetical protein
MATANSAPPQQRKQQPSVASRFAWTRPCLASFLDKRCRVNPPPIGIEPAMPTRSGGSGEYRAFTHCSAPRVVGVACATRLTHRPLSAINESLHLKLKSPRHSARFGPRVISSIQYPVSSIQYTGQWTALQRGPKTRYGGWGIRDKAWPCCRSWPLCPVFAVFGVESARMANNPIWCLMLGRYRLLGLSHVSLSASQSSLSHTPHTLLQSIQPTTHHPPLVLRTGLFGALGAVQWPEIPPLRCNLQSVARHRPSTPATSSAPAVVCTLYNKKTGPICSLESRDRPELRVLHRISFQISIISQASGNTGPLAPSMADFPAGPPFALSRCCRTVGACQQGLTATTCVFSLPS